MEASTELNLQACTTSDMRSAQPAANACIRPGSENGNEYDNINIGPQDDSPSIDEDLRSLSEIDITSECFYESGGSDTGAQLTEPIIPLDRPLVAEMATPACLDEIAQIKTSREVRALRAFFERNRFTTERGDKATNVINIIGGATYNIPNIHIEEFFTLLDDCRKAGCFLHYLERQETLTCAKSGIMIDFDRYQRHKTEQVTESHFRRLVIALDKLIREIVNIPPANAVHIFIIRKPAIVPATLKDGTQAYKDGFHILVPDVCIDKPLKRFLLDQITERKILQEIFGSIDNIQPPEEMLDKMSASNPVHFLGNSKVGKPPYPLVKAWRSIDGSAEKVEVAPLLNGMAKDFDDRDVKINLTYELSLGFKLATFGGEPTWLVKTDYSARPEYQGRLAPEAGRAPERPGQVAGDLVMMDNTLDILTMSNAEAAYIKRLLELLDPTYYTEYDKWYRIVVAIANTNSNYKPIAQWFTSLRPKPREVGQFEQVWSHAVNTHSQAPLTKRSIMYWARLCSPQRYESLNRESYLQLLIRYAYENDGRIEHSMVARVLSVMIGDKFITDVPGDASSNAHYQWYEFVVPGQSMRKGEVYKWRYEPRPDNMHIYISEQLPKIYEQILGNIRARRDAAENEALVKYWREVEKTFKISRSNLSNDGFQNRVISQARYRFRQRGFLDELDSYEDVIGVGNGVLKLGPKVKLITGFHEYKISKFTETNYVPYNPENPYIRELLGIFHDIFPEPDVFEFAMFHAATGLDKREADCILWMMVGGGQNGKTFYLKMIHETLGQYCGSGKMALLTAPMEKSESANSAQMQMLGKSYFYFEEANKCETLNSARLKGIVTPGYQSGRDLHQRQCNFKNTCNPVVASNYDFIITTSDHGTWRRIYYYRNKAKFTANPTPGNPYEKKENRKILHEYPRDQRYKEAMLSIQVHFRERLTNEYGGDIKNVPVPTIEAETEEFRNRQDTVNKFITQMIVYSPGADPISLVTVVQRYHEWHTTNIDRVKHSTIELIAQFENSRIAVHLRRDSSEILYLYNHRIKLSADQPLLPGEKDLNRRVTKATVGDPASNTTMDATTINSAVINATTTDTAAAGTPSDIDTNIDTTTSVAVNPLASLLAS